jgi:hypothetical protein
MPQRLAWLPSEGALVVSTDLHGNMEDFRRLRGVFKGLDVQGRHPHWVLCGDVVHGPDARTRRARPELYGYEDESWEVVAGIVEMQMVYPGRVHFILGNHDHGHVGGPHTSKFYADEVGQLESTMSAKQIEQMHRLFDDALLAVVAPCGVLLSHGSPDDRIARLQDLDGVSFGIGENDEYQEHLLATFLRSYGQPDDVTKRFLAKASASAGFPIGIIVHGHDRDERGWYTEGEHQVCPVTFGAPRAAKRYMLLDLAARYGSVADVRDGHELRTLY